METADFVRAVSALLNGDLPLMPAYPVCVECKMKEQECLLVVRDFPAPAVTVAGCGARCPVTTSPVSVAVAC